MSRCRRRNLRGCHMVCNEQRAARRGEERGSVLIVAAAVVTLLLCISLGSVNIVGGLIARSDVTAIGNCVKLGVSNETRWIKSQDDVGAAVAETAGKGLVANGFTGTATVNVYELSPAEISAYGALDPDAERVVGVTVTFEKHWDALAPIRLPIIADLADGGTVRSSNSWAMVMYAPGQQVWRPATSDCGTYECVVNGGSYSVTKREVWGTFDEARAADGDMASHVLQVVSAG